MVFNLTYPKPHDSVVLSVSQPLVKLTGQGFILTTTTPAPSIRLYLKPGRWSSHVA